MAGVDPTPLINQNDYSTFRSQMYGLRSEQRQASIAVQQPMTWRTVMRFTTGTFAYERPQVPTRDWNTFMLNATPFPSDQVFTGHTNLGGATFSPGPAAVIRTHEELRRLFSSAAQNEFPAIRMVVSRSLEIDSTDRVCLAHPLPLKIILFLANLISP
ncbi:hypothetical protein L873DRAFT_1806674 [Choiromyces venosus 120613-1]|uniref:Uncharacterized protein n=1 Tax=Choiromyces venosus 120613-1 TaxID=1336337 RepID=A0A3N4JMJ2_9PEZI|nr:hypothetical protein L873DRAFT_1806674 [Choiromyces venosus 120613-1]